MRHRIASCLLAGAGLLAGCSAPAGTARAIRLVDLYDPAGVQGTILNASPPARTEWKFASGPSGWEGPSGIIGLTVDDGRLIGTSGTDFPLLHLARAGEFTEDDLVHALEVRMRATAGQNLSVDFRGGEEFDLEEFLEGARDFPSLTASPLVADGQFRSYMLRPRRSVRLSESRHVLLRPTDVAGARFEIESVRLVTRKEHLASIPSGVGWQGLADVFQETLISRSPERVAMTVTPPAGAWLDLSVGTVEYGPVTFKVSVREGANPAGGAPDAGRTLLERTVTAPHRWEPAPVDLSEFAERPVTIALTLAADQPGRLGFWGAPVVRARSKEETGTPRGVIVIWADTLRRDHLDLYGYRRPTSPHLRAMAAGGVLFQDCVSQATWTKVSTPSLMTSLYPTSHTVRQFADRLPASAVTLAEIYRDAGYATLSMSSILFTGAFSNMHQGFEVLHEDTSLPDRESSKTSRVYVDRLLPWLEAHRESPFFVFLHVSDPHDPYRPYPPYDTMWADASKTEEHERQAKDVRKFIKEPLLKAFGMPSREELEKAGFDADAYVEHDRGWYDGSIRAMDAEIGRLFERLRYLGLDRSTLVAFVGDHGEEFLEHGRTFHGQTVYGELTDIPLILWGPGYLPEGRVVSQTARTIDVMPTLLEISGLTPPMGIQGHSMMAAIRGAGLVGQPAGTVTAAEPAAMPGESERDAVSEKAATEDGTGSPPPHDTESYAIVSQGWKLVHNVRRPEGASEFELYDERADPLNQHDLAPGHPEIVARLAGRLSAWKSMVEAGRLPSDESVTQSLSAEELERLRSLGYIQ